MPSELPSDSVRALHKGFETRENGTPDAWINPGSSTDPATAGNTVAGGALQRRVSRQEKGLAL